MKRLGYPFALVIVSLLSVVFFTTVTALTLESYTKIEKGSSPVVKDDVIREIETVSR